MTIRNQRIITPALAVLALVLASCGSAGPSVELQAAESVTTTTLASEIETTTSESLVSSNESDSRGTGSEEAEEAEDAPARFPPAALPTSEVWELNSPTYGAATAGGDAFFAVEAGMVRLNTENDEIDTVVTIEEQYHQSPFGLVSVGDQVLTAWSTQGLFVDSITSLNAETLAVSARRDAADGEQLSALQALGETTTALLVSFDGLVPTSLRVASADPATLDDPIPVTETDGVWAYQRGTSLVTWDASGSGRVVDIETGEDLQEFDFGIELLDSSVVATTGNTTWIADVVTATIWPLLADTHELGEPIELSELFEGRAVRLNQTTGSDRYLSASVIDGDVEWLILMALNEDGSIEWQRTVNRLDQSSLNALNSQAAHIVASDRLFVRDHALRIVEVDLDGIDEPTPWTPLNIELSPVLTIEEQEVAEVVQRILDGEDVGATNPEVSAVAREQFAPFLAGSAIMGVLVHGDFAYAEVQRGNEFPGLIVLERRDEQWIESSQNACNLLGLEC